MKWTITLTMAIWMMVGSLMAQVEIGNLQLDWIEWGMREVFVTYDNKGDDSARLRLTISTLYQDHYLSGLDLYEEDTALFLPPHQKVTVHLGFELPGSFGRAVSRAFAYWNYPENSNAEYKSDSVAQTFSSVFNANTDASIYAERRHCPGPAFAPHDYPMLNFEFPRLLLYLLSRQWTVDKICRIFIVNQEYAHKIRQDLTDQGLFPVADNFLAPGILAISEAEGFILKPELRAAANVFTEWYDSKSRMSLQMIFDKAGINQQIAELPALQMEILLNLLKEQWIDAKLGFENPQYENANQDIVLHNRPRFVIQGGWYFMPKLSLAAVEADDGLILATFSPDPKKPIEKMVIQELTAAIDSVSRTIPAITSEQIKDVIKRAKKKKLTADINEALMTVIEKAKAEIEFIKPYQYPYLADYIYRVVLGEYFIQHPPSGGHPEYIRVRYEK